MSDLIDDLLELSRVTRSDVSRNRVDLSELARTIIAEFQQKEPERAVGVTVQGGLVAECDSRLIRLMLENLLYNAWKFTSKIAQAEIGFGATVEEGVTTFFVRDNGAGFDMKYASKLFKVFQRLHRPEQFEGTGVGLAIVQRVVHRHGGQVWAESKPGEGATFCFSLPVTDEQNGAEKPSKQF